MIKIKNNIITTVLGILTIIMGAFICYREFANNEEEKPQSDNHIVEKENETKEENTSSKEHIFSAREIIKGNYFDEEDWQTVYIDLEDKLTIERTDNKKTVLIEDVRNVFSVKVGQTDTCYGNEWLIVNQNNGGIKAVSVDNLLCGNEITIKIIDLKEKEQFKKIDIIGEAYNIPSSTNQYEPYLYKAYVLAISSNGTDKKQTKTIEITNILR